MKKTFSIQDLKVNQRLENEYFALNEYEKKFSRLDKPYYNIVLSDKTGEVRGKIWSDSIEKCDANAKIGEIVKVSGAVQEYNGKPQLIVEKLEVCADMAPEEFLPVTSRDRGMMISELEDEIRKTKDIFLRKLLEAFWDNASLRDRYVNFPAGMYVHHGYVGGLLEHVWEMNRLSKPYIEIYPQINRDLLFTGIFFHDIGKLDELDIVGATIIKTDEGNLVAHIGQGLLFLDRFITSNISSMPEQLKTKIFHLILSHQGAPELGSPITPHTLEALVLSMIDDDGAKMNQATKHIEKNLASGESFTEYHKHLGTSFYQKDYILENNQEE